MGGAMTISRAKIDAALAVLAARFPQTFTPEKFKPHRPLKVGIADDIRGRYPELIDPHAYRRAQFLRPARRVHEERRCRRGADRSRRKSGRGSVAIGGRARSCKAGEGAGGTRRSQGGPD